MLCLSVSEKEKDVGAKAALENAPSAGEHRLCRGQGAEEGLICGFACGTAG